MKRHLSILVAGMIVLGSAGMLHAQCPEAPHDPGTCDTLYVEVYPSDTLFTGFVRVLLYVTHDVPNPQTDSLAAFVIPLCYTRTNPAKYCSLTHYWNNPFLYPFPPDLLERSVYRHVTEDGDTIIHNWMMDQAQLLTGVEWDERFMNLDGTSHFWFKALNSNLDQDFGEYSRVLLATATFRMEDTMTICLDTCLWPPSNQLIFVPRWTRDSDPRHFLPYCFSVSYPELGDVNADGVVDIGDVVYLINYLYRGSPTPVLAPVGDTNCDGVVDIGDVVFLVNYLFRGGPPPECP
jgi:hypothetical protein